MIKKTVIAGATPNVTRYAFKAAELMNKHSIPFVPMGIKKGEVFGQEILDMREKPKISEVDTITLYVGTNNQEEWYEYWLSLNPKRIIFNPGTENFVFEKMVREKGIEVLHACTLVLITIGEY